MKILLVNPPSYNPYDLRRGEPLGLAYIAAVLENRGFANNVEIMDPNVHRTLPPLDMIVKDILRKKPDILGFSTYNIRFRDTLRIAREVKKQLQESFVVFGGHLATAIHDTVLKKFCYVDAVVRGEGEYTLLELVKAIEDHKNFYDIMGLTWRKDGKIIVNPARPLIKNLDELPFPARHLLPPLKDYDSKFEGRISAAVLSSRGCPYNCIFCDIRSFYGSSPGFLWRGRSPEIVVDEIEFLLNDGIEFIRFVDDNFLVHPSHAKRICKEIIRRRLKPAYSFETRCDQIVRQRTLLPLIKRSGCVFIELGVENASQAVLNRYNKQLSVKDNEKALELIRKASIRYSLSFILFDRLTTIEELKQNLSFIERNDITLTDFIYYTYLQPIPGTTAYKEYLKEGGGKNYFFKPTYRLKDEKAHLLFIAMQDFKKRFESTRAKRKLEIEDKLVEIQTLRSHYEKRKSQPDNKRITKELTTFQDLYTFHNIIIKRFPYTFFKLILEEAKNSDTKNFKERTRLLYDLMRRDIVSEYRIIDLINRRYRLFKEKLSKV